MVDERIRQRLAEVLGVDGVAVSCGKFATEQPDRGVIVTVESRRPLAVSDGAAADGSQFVHVAVACEADQYTVARDLADAAARALQGWRATGLVARVREIEYQPEETALASRGIRERFVVDVFVQSDSSEE